jgi:VIT1/CCC1 family predicted Fe2+/Mn2+ transporter
MTDLNFWSKRIQEGAMLNPADRISEVLFGLIMVLSFTGAISVTTDAREDVRELLWAALGCNVAWGLIDAVMYLMNVAIERGHSILMIKKIHESKDPEESVQILKDEIQPAIAALLTTAELNEVSNRIRKLPEPSKKHVLTGTDLWAGVQIFFLVFLCTLPVALPFALIDDLALAMRASNGVAVLLLFIGGFLLASFAGFRKGITAIVYTLIGVSLVAITMALGG